MFVTPNKTLIELRHKKGESQSQAAKNIGISQSMLAMLEAGYRKGSDETKIKIADYYDEPIGKIFFTINCH